MKRDLPSTVRNPRRLWSAITILLLIAVVMEAVFAGAMFSGVGWARATHSTMAIVLLASMLTAALASFISLRHIPNGTKLGLTLLSLTAVTFLQIAAGKLTAAGSNLLWVHVPLGAALVGLFMLAVARARSLGAE